MASTSVPRCVSVYLLIAVSFETQVAITKAHIMMPECKEAMDSGRLVADGKILLGDGSSVVTKAAIEHVWHLPGVAKRFNITEATLRRCMFEQTGGMFPELITRSDIDVFLPPIGGQTVYIFGPPEYCRDESKVCTVHTHARARTHTHTHTHTNAILICIPCKKRQRQ